MLVVQVIDFVLVGAVGAHVRAAPDRQLGDDALSAPIPLPFTFDYPGGSTNSILVESNGNVWLQPPAHANLLVNPGPGPLLSRLPKPNKPKPCLTMS